MTKTIALVLAAASLVACAADDSTGSEHASQPDTVAPTGGDSSPDCPAPESAAPKKAAGLVETCEGAYLCKYGPNYDAADEVHLFSDGSRCIGRYAGSKDMVFMPDGTLTYDTSHGTWTGNAIAWDYTLTDHNGSTWSKSCARIAGK